MYLYYIVVYLVHAVYISVCRCLHNAVVDCTTLLIPLIIVLTPYNKHAQDGHVVSYMAARLSHEIIIIGTSTFVYGNNHGMICGCVYEEIETDHVHSQFIKRCV